MQRRYFILLLIMLLLGPLLSPELVAGEKEPGSDRPSMANALPETHTITLTLNEAGETFSFSMTVASRHFSMNLGDKNIALRGRLWRGQGGIELLDYTLEFTQWVEGPESGRQRSGSTWNGSTHLRNGKPVQIATFLDGSFTIQFDKQK